MAYTIPLLEFFQTSEPDILIGQVIEATNLLESQRLEEQTLDIDSVLSSGPCPSNPVPGYPHCQLSLCVRTRLPDELLFSPQTSSPASIAADATLRRRYTISSSTPSLRTTTLAVGKKPKKVRFATFVESFPYKKGEDSRTINQLEAHEAHQESLEPIEFLDRDLGHSVEDIDIFLLTRHANASLILSVASVQDSKQALLRFLDERTNEQYLCRSCDLFHRAPPTRQKNISKEQLAESCCASEYIIGPRRPSGAGRLFDSAFSFAQIQYAMKLSRQGSYFCERLKKPLCHPTIDIHRCYTHIRTSDVYPAFDRLLHRTQHWYHVSSDIKYPFSKADLIDRCRRKSRMPDRKMAILCQHMYFPEDGKELWDFQNQENNPLVKRCQHCALEYRFDWYDAGEHGSGIVLSIWRDLGRCLTPFDPRWMAHFDEYKASDFNQIYQKDLEVASRWHLYMEPAVSEAPLGYIQKMFEASGGFDVQDGLVMLISERRKVSFEKARKKRKETINMDWDYVNLRRRPQGFIDELNR